MPAYILNAIEDYADTTGLTNEKVVELAFSMFLDLDATSFAELKTSKSPSLILQENQVLSHENAILRQELEALKEKRSDSEPLA